MNPFLTGNIVKEDMTDNTQKAYSSSTWHANLELGLVHNDRGTRLAKNRHVGPLYVQKPFYPEGRDTAHIYLLHPPGGLVSGDLLDIHINVENKAHGLITTPGAARMYRARLGESVQKQYSSINVGEKAIVEWFPMESIIYNGADADVRTTINLQNESRYIAWEISCFGLPASHSPFELGRFSQRYMIKQNNKPIFVDQVNYNPGHKGVDDVWFKNAAGMQSNTVTGFLLAGPFSLNTSQRNNLTETLRSVLGRSKQTEQFAVSWNQHCCIVRYLGQSAYTARQTFTLLWQTIRPILIGKKACEPRIWLT